MTDTEHRLLMRVLRLRTLLHLGHTLRWAAVDMSIPYASAVQLQRIGWAIRDGTHPITTGPTPVRHGPGWAMRVYPCGTLDVHREHIARRVTCTEHVHATAPTQQRTA